MSEMLADPRFHDSIGLVYDSALDPAVWPLALEAMCGLVDGCYGSMSVMDPVRREIRLAAEWCPDPDWPRWKKLLDEKYAAMMPLYSSLLTWDIGAVHNTEQMAAMVGMDMAAVYEHPFFKEWALPAGRRDSLGCVVLRSADRFGLFNVHTSTKRELTGPRELAIFTALAPHVRRAVTIGDLLGMAIGKAATLQATLDTLNTAVVVTDSHAQIIHSNAAADAMLRTGAPIGSAGGQLQALQSLATSALHTAIRQTVEPADVIGGNGIGVPLRTGDGNPAIAHVLPLARQTPQRDFGPGASAAVFISPADHAPPAAEALIGLFGLTPMEARVMLQVAAGRRRLEAALALGIADSTAKTHLDRIYDKTGVNEQMALSRLVASLASPARKPD